MIKFKLRYQNNTKQIKFFRTFDHIKMQMFRTNALSSKKKKKRHCVSAGARQVWDTYQASGGDIQRLLKKKSETNKIIQLKLYIQQPCFGQSNQ
jgi:hypothetical protein